MDDNAHIRSILSLMSVGADQWPGFYVLGCFSRHATLYSQQVRSLNLVYALVQTRRIRPGIKIAIVGAGAAGMTAAVAAAAVGAKVTLLEQLDAPLGIQSQGCSRYLHPHIYDWPEEGAEEDDAQLPVLNWKAGVTDSVSEHILHEWKLDLSWYKDSIQTYFRVSSIDFEVSTGGTTVTWNGSSAEGDEFELVFVTVGFGLEPADWPQRRYWHNDDLQKRDEAGVRRCLVSGCGDGGLTDLMRLCIRDFRHDEIIKTFSRHPDAQAVANRLQEVERQFLQDGSKKGIGDFYRQELKVPRLQQILQSSVRTDTEVYLTARSFWDIYSSKAPRQNNMTQGLSVQQRNCSLIDQKIVNLF